MLRLAVTLRRVDQRHFRPRPGPYYFAAFVLQKKFIKIYHLVSFEPCQRLCFNAGCGGQGPPPKCWDAIIKRWAEDSHPATFCPQTHDIFPLFSQFFWHLAFFISASSSLYFSSSFSYNAVKTVWPLSSCSTKNSNRSTTGNKAEFISVGVKANSLDLTFIIFVTFSLEILWTLDA